MTKYRKIIQSSHAKYECISYIKPEIQTTVTSVCSVHPICMAWTTYPNTSKSRLRTRWPTLDALARTTSNFWALSLQANHIKTTV